MTHELKKLSYIVLLGRAMIHRFLQARTVGAWRAKTLYVRTMRRAHGRTCMSRQRRLLAWCRTLYAHIHIHIYMICMCKYTSYTYAHIQHVHVHSIHIHV